MIVRDPCDDRSRPTKSNPIYTTMGLMENVTRGECRISQINRPDSRDRSILHIHECMEDTGFRVVRTVKLEEM